MASFENPTFDPNADPPQHSLRCISERDNKKGSTQWTNFRRGWSDYRAGGRYAQYRLGPPGHMSPGDTFYVNFDLSGFDPNDAAHQALKDK